MLSIKFVIVDSRLEGNCEQYGLSSRIISSKHDFNFNVLNEKYNMKPVN